MNLDPPSIGVLYSVHLNRNIYSGLFRGFSLARRHIQIVEKACFDRPAEAQTKFIFLRARAIDNLTSKDLSIDTKSRLLKSRDTFLHKTATCVCYETRKCYNK